MCIIYITTKTYGWSKIDFSVYESVSECFCGEFFVLLLAILLPIESPVACVVFWITLLETVLRVSIAQIFVW